VGFFDGDPECFVTTNAIEPNQNLIIFFVVRSLLDEDSAFTELDILFVGDDIGYGNFHHRFAMRTGTVFAGSRRWRSHGRLAAFTKEFYRQGTSV
jgi:hypothetical protein